MTATLTTADLAERLRCSERKIRKAAAALKISTVTLWRKMKRYGLSS